MQRPHFPRAATAACLSLCVSLASAQALESPLPAGLKGKLVIQVEARTGGKPASSVEFDLALVSEATAPSHLLMGDMDEDMRRDVQQYEKAGKALTESNVMDPERMRKAFALLDTCRANENSATCKQGKQAMQDVERDMAALQERGQQEQARAPGYTSQHRYQSWSGSPMDGCGTLRARLGERSLQLPAAGSKEASAVACGTRLVVDRRSGEVSLMITPLRLAFPAQGNARPAELSFDGLGPGSGAEFNHQTGTLYIRKQPALRQHKQLGGTTSYRSPRGVVTTVRWTFTPL